MFNAYIRAIKKRGLVVALALCRSDETKERDYSQYWSEKLQLIELFPPNTPPAEIRRRGYSYWGYCYSDPESCPWGTPVIVTSYDWPDDFKLESQTTHWPNCKAHNY